MKTRRTRFVLDTFGLTETELREMYPHAYQYLFDYVRPEREQNSDAAFRARWWLMGRPRPELRAALRGLHRYIVTCEVAKHRVFTMLAWPGDLIDGSVIAIASSDYWSLGVISSEVAQIWILAAGGTLEDRPRFHTETCFDRFPFPAATETQQARIRELGEQLDAHRKRQQAAHPDLTLTGMYNVLEKLRAGETLTTKERTIHERGLVSVLRQLHDELDAAVLEAYGWSDLLPLLQVAHGNAVPPLPLAGEGRGEGKLATTLHDSPHPPSAPSSASGGREKSESTAPASEGREESKRAFDESILERLVTLNAERAAEEARGVVRWLRPEFQHPIEAAPTQTEIETGAEAIAATAAAVAAKPQAWPADAIAQVRAVADALAASTAPLSVDDITARFKARGPWKKRVPALLDMLVALGRAQEKNGHYRAVR